MNRPAKYIIADARKRRAFLPCVERRSASPRAHVSPSGDLMNLPRELFLRGTGCCLSYGWRMDANTSRKGVAGNGRVMIYLAFGLENDFLRYRIAVVHHAGRTLPGHGARQASAREWMLRGRVPQASSGEPCNVSW